LADRGLDRRGALPQAAIGIAGQAAVEPKDRAV